jgi:uncharacterized membrane protein (UPF0127 family)
MSEFVCVMNDSQGTVLASRARLACSLAARTRGLLGTASLPSGTGLWLKPCRSIHTFFMRYPIDVLFLDPAGKVVAQKTLSPWRLSGWIPRAQSVVELPAGTLVQSGSKIGDQISCKRI